MPATAPRLDRRTTSTPNRHVPYPAWVGGRPPTPRADRWGRPRRPGGALVKPSLLELRDLLQQPLKQAADWCSAAQSLVRSGTAGIVALSVGEQGAVLATREGVWQAPALNVPATSGTTGAGDCFLATLVWA